MVQDNRGKIEILFVSALQMAIHLSSICWKKCLLLLNYLNTFAESQLAMYVWVCYRTLFFSDTILMSILSCLDI